MVMPLFFAYFLRNFYASVMRMDFELLEEIIEDLDESDSKIMKQYLLEGRLFKEIADDEGRTYEAIKKRMERIRAEIREEILECLEMNCRGGERDERHI